MGLDSLSGLKLHNYFTQRKGADLVRRTSQRQKKGTKKARKSGLSSHSLDEI